MKKEGKSENERKNETIERGQSRRTIHTNEGSKKKRTKMGKESKARKESFSSLDLGLSCREPDEEPRSTETKKPGNMELEFFSGNHPAVSPA
jgi:hypothetical protein